MSAITLAQAQAQQAAWLAASLAVANAQTATINGRTVTKADAKEIREQITFWTRKVNELQRAADGGSRMSTSLATFGNS